MGKEISVMDILDHEDVEWIASHGKRLGVEKDQVLIREGETVDSLFVLLDGCLDIIRGGHQVSTVHSGEIVGEVSFVDSRPPMATVTAAVYSKVLAIPRIWCGQDLRPMQGSQRASFAPCQLFLRTGCGSRRPGWQWKPQCTDTELLPSNVAFLAHHDAGNAPRHCWQLWH